MEILFILIILLTIVTVVGHLIWVVIASVVRAIFVEDVVIDDESRQRSDPRLQRLKNLAITEDQISQFYSNAKVSEKTFEELMERIRAERSDLVMPRAAARAPIQAPVPIQTPPPVAKVIEPATDYTDKSVASVARSVPVKEPPPPPPPPEPRPPRRSFPEVLNSFMEESNIRWGEIIGGLLIIGCSTALVVSLWAQISQIPVLKFLIFTTVTAILFGIGLYTEHRWKLPTTSRGILTIATLLVPLNFLAIAAVSSSNTSGALVIGSELAAPAIFLCLVYFAGRVITPGCGHILSAGVLGSSVGQLLVRHFASVEYSPSLLIFLGAFPVACYVVTVGLALRFVLHDREIDESETSTIFTVFGTMSFAALLPFGLLLYKSGPIGMSMMYLAPLVTLWGVPMVATGTILWKRITNKELVASRTIGTALGILGVMIVLAGMILAWPNPSSIVPAALLSFAIFTVLAVALEISVAHVLATICFALAYLVAFHVLAGNMTWVNLRVMSLLNTSLSVASGQALVGAAALFVAGSEWLAQRKRERDSVWYLVSACLVAVVSLALTLGFGIGALEYHALWVVLGLYSLGAFWIAWRRKLLGFSWIGSALLLFTLVHVFGPTFSFSFPWQTALFAHATICAAAAIVCSRYKALPRAVFTTPFNYSALISIVLGVISLFQANTWEVTWMQAQRVYWIAGILLLLLWLNRLRLIFNAFQVALIAGLVLTVKAALQGYDWYEYLPHAFLHPAALQIQGTVLALLCLAFLAARFVVRRAVPDQHNPTRRLIDARLAVDRLLVWVLLGGFLLLAGYGSLSGLIYELGGVANSINVAGFPHQEAFGLGSWIVLGLLLLAMIGTFWERRRGIYLLGALATLSAVIPLLAGQFETQPNTATAWRWLAAAFFVAGSMLLWYRDQISRWLARFGWPALDGDVNAVVSRARKVLIVLTVLPLIVLTVTPAWLAMIDVMFPMRDLAIQGPTTGFFGNNLSFGVPLVLAALVMIGYARRELMPEFAFYAGVVFNLTVTLAFLLAVATGNVPVNEAFAVRLFQLNAITFAVYALPWICARGRWQSILKDGELRFANFLLKLQLGIPVVLNTILFLTIVGDLLGAPHETGVGTAAAGSFVGWLTFALIATGVAWLGATRMIKLRAFSLLGFLLTLCCIVAFNVSSDSGWLGAHVLTVCVALSAWIMLAVAELDADPTNPLPFPINLIRLTFHLDGNWKRRARECAAIAGGVAVCLSLRTLYDADANREWSIGPMLAIALLAATLNWKTLQRPYIYASGILVSLSVSLWWIFAEGLFFREFWLSNLTAASLAGIVFLCLELRARRLRVANPVFGPGFSFHHIVAICSFSLLAFFVFLDFVGVGSRPLLLGNIVSVPVFLSVVALMTACLWDRSAVYAVAGLYGLGLIGGALLLNGIYGTQLAWAATMLLAAYTLFWALLWRRRAALIAFAEQFGIPRRLDPESTALPWFSVFTVFALSLITTVAYWLNFALIGNELRAAAALAVSSQFLTLSIMADQGREQRWRYPAIVMLTIGMVLCGWSWLTPGVDATWLNRSVILMLEAWGLAAVYGLLRNKANARFPEWTSSARACVPWLLGGGAVALLFCVATEISHQINFGAVQIHPVPLVAIGLTLVAAVVACVYFALSPEHDPLSLSERWRPKYVYVAEVMLALLFLHIRLTMPWLFTGFIERYWPMVIMLIAYFGVVASEALKRRKLLVLAQPLERTGAFLPMLPVLGFWFASSEVDFSLLLFIVGGLYGLLSILRRSFGFGVLAAIAGNAGLWYMWNRTTDYQFMQHPQLWLIPVALSVLFAAYMNEDKLSEDQMTGIRYLSLVTIYVSSTADIFINGVANTPWLPLILGAFSLSGVFAGIVFRVRGLLLLGAIFLLLSIVTMICYASVNFGWTWLWYVAGIATGATIIFMFAVFEKKRNEVLRVVEGLKDWER